MSRPRLVRAAAPALLLALVTVSGCGSSTGDDDGAVSASSGASASEDPSEAAEPTGSPSSEAADPTAPAGTPPCAEVWVDGGTLPRAYAGCEEAGALVEKDALPCSSGQRLVRYADRFYGVPGGTVHEVTSPLDQDPDYTADVRSCRA